MKTPSLLKKILAALSSKTNELRIRIMIFFLLHKNIDKSALTHKLHALVSHHNHHNIPHLKIDEFIEDSEEKIKETQFEDQEEVYNNHEEQQKNPSLLMYYNKVAEGGEAQTESVPRVEEDEEEENLTHVLFKESVAALEEEEEEEGVAVEEGGGAVAEVVEEAEEDIDQAADMFIKRFKQQIQLQKQYSLERHNQRVLQATVWGILVKKKKKKFFWIIIILFLFFLLFCNFVLY